MLGLEVIFVFKFITGDILDSEAYCLVNTVNCQGYMGKGIAYQFKLKYPENNRDYEKACKTGSLKIGTLHHFREGDKLIVNFPTKVNWRAKSKIDYIHAGLGELVRLVQDLNIESIAIPPLGCGNGGLNWNDVKPVIVEYFKAIIDHVDVVIYEPSNYYRPNSIKQPSKLTTAHLVLMLFKAKLSRFSKLRLHKSAYFLNIFMGDNYFRFEKHKYGPYAHSIDVLIKDIRQFQTYYKLSTDDAFTLAKTSLISHSVEKKLQSLSKHIDQASDFINSIPTDKELELLSSICILAQESTNTDEDQLIQGIKDWSEEKSKKFTDQEIKSGIDLLTEKGILVKDLLGYTITRLSHIN